MSSCMIEFGVSHSHIMC